MLRVHVVPQLVQLLPDNAQAIVELGLDNELVVFQRIKINRRLNHLLQLSQAI